MINRTMTTMYGLMAEFDDPEQLLVAVERAREAGYRRMDAYSPFPVHGMEEALGIRRTRLPILILLGGLIGGLLGYAMQYYILVIDYPYNIGGRPLHSWPTYIPITFEMTVLLAAFAAVFGMIALNGLPQPYHPVFNAPRFELASTTQFFLCIESTDPQFDALRTRQFLESLQPREVTEVEY